MLEMWKQNAIRKGALTFRLILYYNVLNVHIGHDSICFLCIV